MKLIIHLLFPLLKTSKQLMIQAIFCLQYPSSGGNGRSAPRPVVAKGQGRDSDLVTVLKVVLRGHRVKASAPRQKIVTLPSVEVCSLLYLNCLTHHCYIILFYECTAEHTRLHAVLYMFRM